MKKFNFAVPVAAFVAGAAIGYVCAPSGRGPAEAPQNQADPRTKVVKFGLDDSSSVDSMRRREKKLKEELAEERRRNGEDSRRIADDGDRPRREGRRPGRGQWMEEMKKNDPERYAAITNNIARGIQMRREKEMEKLNILSAGFDTSGMSPDELRNHNNLISLLEKREELVSRLFTPPEFDSGMTDEERRQAHGAMHEIMHEISGLYDAERKALVSQAVKTMGYEGDEAEEIAGYFNDVFEATRDEPFGPRRGFGGGSGGRRGGR